MKRRFVFACIEKEPPYILALNELDGESLEYAEERRRHALWSYYDCEQSGNWGAYGSGVNMCRLPPWELMRGRDDE